MLRTLSYATLFLWVLSPLALFGVVAAFGTPHVIAGYTFIDNGRKYDPFAERYYLTCTFWGATGAHKLPARGGQCPWVRMLK